MNQSASLATRPPEPIEQAAGCSTCGHVVNVWDGALLRFKHELRSQQHVAVIVLSWRQPGHGVDLGMRDVTVRELPTIAVSMLIASAPAFGD